MGNNNHYPGGKNGNGVYQNIINIIPPIEMYVEPMVGGGGVFKNLRLPAVTVINDCDSGVIDRYNCKIHGVFVYNEDYRSLIGKLNYTAATTLFYFDPPYVMDVRKSKARIYKYEFNIYDHYEFLEFILTLPGLIVISCYDCRLYSETLKHWNKFKFLATTRHGLVEETVYYNYEISLELQDYRYIGKNFIHRQQIKRKFASFQSKVNLLSQLEKNALKQFLKF